MEPMFKAPISGLRAVMWPTRSAMGSPTHPVEKFTMMSGTSARIAWVMAR